MDRWKTRASGAASERHLIQRLEACATPLRGPEDLDPLLEAIGDSRYVLLGEASHGTSEFYTWRQAISQRLIEEKGFSFIAVEGDWPDCYRVNRYVKHRADAGSSAHDVLHAFDRWPTWMWANEEVAGLADWLHGFNAGRPEEAQVGFYGLDVYSLWDSLDAVVKYLDEHDPEGAKLARDAYRCFEPYWEDEHGYARATLWVPHSCQSQVVALLTEMRGRARELQDEGREGYFNAEQNALITRNAELYYRTMVRGDSESWNVRDRHMVQTLERLMQHHGSQAKAIVWEHNTHIGDARATDMARDGMVNVGQLVRERHGDEGVSLVGFGSHRGTVIAGRSWGAPMEVMEVPEGRAGSYEDLMHRALEGDGLLLLEGLADDEALLESRGHRAIGVVYHPSREMFGNYVPTVLPHRYDAFLFIDETHALRPLHMVERAEHEPPETYPSGM